MYAGKAAYDAATTLALGERPWATWSTYIFVAASWSPIGSVKSVIRFELTLILPVGCNVMLPVDIIVTLLPTNVFDNKLPPEILAVTANVPSVPTEVMFVWLAVVSVPAMLVPDRLPPEILPVTDNDVNVPTDVILGWLAVVNVPAMLVPDRLPPEILPVTVKSTSVPT